MSVTWAGMVAVGLCVLGKRDWDLIVNAGLARSWEIARRKCGCSHVA
jgi:hypothetical protein